MKKLFTTFCATLLAVAASAQTVETTGALTPRAHSVYSTAEYPSGITASYDNLITESDSVSAKATATLTYGSQSVSVERDSITSYRAYFNINGALSQLGVANGETFTVAISNIVNADTISREVEVLSTTYKYLSAIPTPNIDPAEGVVTSKEFPVTFTYTDSMVVEYIGTRSGAGSNIVANVFDGNTTTSPTITFNVVDSLWESSATDLTLTLDGLKDAEGYYYPNVSVTYTNGVDTVAYLGVDPDPEWTYYEDLVGWPVDFMFDKAVEIPVDATVATVTFYSEDGEMLDVAELRDTLAICDYSYWMNCYVLELEVPSVTSAAEGYSYAVVQLQGITYNGQLLDQQPSATYYTSSTSAAKAHSNGLTSVQSPLNTKSATADVYNLQGSLVKKGISTSELNSLNKGIYIVGGRKVIIK